MEQQQDNTPQTTVLQFEALPETIEAVLNHAVGLARSALHDAGVMQLDGAVKGLAATVLVMAAELCAGGNPERPAFKTYSDGLITLVSNVHSPFACGGPGERIDG